MLNKWCWLYSGFLLHRMPTRYFTLFIAFSFPFFVTGQSLDKAFAALNAGEYDYAAELLYRITQKNDDPVAEYGLAQIYFMKDNKKYNLDSANHYLLRSAAVLNKSWKESDPKKFP